MNRQIMIAVAGTIAAAVTTAVLEFNCECNENQKQKKKKKKKLKSGREEVIDVDVLPGNVHRR